MLFSKIHETLTEKINKENSQKPRKTNKNQIKIIMAKMYKNGKKLEKFFNLRDINFQKGKEGKS